MSKFKPMLAPNKQPNLDELSYPLLSSNKLDGIRCIFKNGEMLSRSLKQIQNKQLHQRFQVLKNYTKIHNVILDGEIYSHKLTFQEITSFVMTQDFTDKKSIKKFGKIMEIPEHLNFYMFDCVEDNDFELAFNLRTIRSLIIVNKFPDLIVSVKQVLVKSPDEVRTMFKKVLENGYEGLILKDSNGRYKCGRATLKEGLMYKCKNFRTFDAKIKDVIQATEVNEDVEKKINELGRSVTSKKIGQRHVIEKAAAFLVDYEGKDLKVVIALTDTEKEEIWENKEQYINKIIEYKGMLEGAKDVPRHPVFLRYRNDKE